MHYNKSVCRKDLQSEKTYDKKYDRLWPCRKSNKQQKITVELKSVNHRYLDLNIKMPRKFNMLEGQVRNLMKQYMQRGKVDVFITYEDYTGGNVALKYNHDLAAAYLGYLKQMSEEFGLENDIRCQHFPVIRKF